MRGPSRRAFLSSVAGTAAMLAGCSQSASQDSTPTESDAPSPFHSVDVTGEAVVVALAETVDVSKVSLIGPDGTAVGSTDVAAGQTEATLPILEVNSGISGYEHYTPGTHELVAVMDGDEISRSLSLRPDIRVVDVEQYREGYSIQDYGRIAVTLENQGTAPTWAYDIAFDQAPNYSANTELTDNIGLPYVRTPSEESSVIIPPRDRQSYISQHLPLVLTGNKYTCEDTTADFTAKIGIASGNILTKSISVNLSGTKSQADITGSVVCDQSTVVLQGGQ